MIYKIILGLVSTMFGYYVYTISGLVDPIKTLAAAVFLALAAAIFLDSEESESESD